MITIKDIAKHCGVSVSTVSYALSGHSNIAEKTKERIRLAAKELNYIPNSNARSLKQKKTYQIGVFVPGFQGTIHPSILAGIAHVLRNIDIKYNMIVTFTDDDMLLIKNHSIDLAIIMDGKTPKETVEELSKYVPIITFDQSSNGKNIFNTTIDNYNTSYQLTKRLIDQDCKHIGFILGSNASHHNQTRFNGYKQALKESGLPIDDQIIFNANAFTVFKGHEIIDNHLKNFNKPLFDGLVCCNDELALGAIDALKSYGYHAPKDYLITGFDDIEQTKYSDPPLTTAHVDWYDYGIKIAEFALQILNKENVKQSFSVPVRIIDRLSTNNH